MPDSVSARIASWGLPAEVEDEVYDRLNNELGGHPDEHIRTVRAPCHLEQYSFKTKTDSARFTFVFRVQRQDDGSITIEDCYRLPFPITIIHGGRSLPVVPPAVVGEIVHDDDASATEE